MGGGEGERQPGGVDSPYHGQLAYPPGGTTSSGWGWKKSQEMCQEEPNMDSSWPTGSSPADGTKAL